MDSALIQGLRISGLSYLLIFVVLGVLYGLIKLLLKILPPRNDQE